MAASDSRPAPLVEVCVQTGTLVLAGAAVVAADGSSRSIGVLCADVNGTVRVAYRKL